MGQRGGDMFVLVDTEDLSMAGCGELLPTREERKYGNCGPSPRARDPAGGRAKFSTRALGGGLPGQGLSSQVLATKRQLVSP